MEVDGKEEKQQDLTLQTQEGEEVVVGYKVACVSRTIKDMLEAVGDDGDTIIPLANVTKPVLLRVIEFCTQHQDDPTDLTDDDYITPLEGWDKAFVESLSTKELFDVLMAANFLDIKALLWTGCKRLADIVRSTTETELLGMFGFSPDQPITRDEKKAVMQEHPFLMDDCDDIPEMRELRDEILRERKEADRRAQASSSEATV